VFDQNRWCSWQIGDWASSEFTQMGRRLPSTANSATSFVQGSDESDGKPDLTREFGKLQSAYVDDKLAASANFTLTVEPIDPYITQEAQKPLRMMSDRENGNMKTLKNLPQSGGPG
jgi:hypothetical protein